jgi:AraC-like DNA-binding protein
MQNADLGFLSIPVLKQYLKQADALGVDCASMLQSAGVSKRDLEDNSGRIRGEALQDLLSDLIAVADDPCFGLHSSVFVQPTTYSVVGYIALNCASLREILDNIPLLERIVGSTGVTTIQVENGHVLQRWDCRFQQEDVRRHLVENVLGSWQYYSRNYLGFPPADCILLEHAPPSSVDMSVYRDIFGCEVKFDQPFNAVRILQESLDLTLPEADTNLLSTLLEHATQILKESDTGQHVSTRVRNLLRFTLREGIASREEVAAKLGVSGRTLQRQLINEGTHYQELLTQLRHEMASHYLKNSKLPMETIAARLGYSETRSFYRGFSQWTGVTPGDFRSQAGKQH